MLRILQTLLALICLLTLAFVAARANGGEWQAPDPGWQAAPCGPAVCAGGIAPRVHHCLVPGPQPGTYLQGQPFAYGYFGAYPQRMAVYHRSSSGDWSQWYTFRAN
jgi:hypothetical protein